MTSKIGIISNAYFLLGAAPVNTLSPTSSLDVGASNIYDVLIPQTLAAFQFVFAQKISALNRLSTDPADTKYKYAYAMPPDLLSMIAFSPYITFDYTLIGSQLWCNEENIKILYNYQAPTAMTPSYIELYLIYLLAKHLAIQVTGSLDIWNKWSAEVSTMEPIVKHIDSSQVVNPIVDYDGLIAAFESG